MNRRDAIKNTALLMGGALSATTLSAVLNGCNASEEKGEKSSFTENEKSMITKIADVIIPKTHTPGAVDVGVPAFITMMIQDCYDETTQKKFHKGLETYSEWCAKKYGENFLELPADKQKKAVADLDKAVLGEEKNEKLSFYKTFKELTLLGFFTSESGATETLRYIQVPGDYDGCVPYKKGDKAWAT